MSIKDSMLASVHADKSIPWAKADADEQHVIAAVLRDRSEGYDAYHEAAMVLSPASFRVEANRLIWTSVQALMSGAGAVSPGRLASHLDRSEKLERVGGRAYLEDLAGLGSADPGEVLVYAQSVERAFDERELQRLADRIARERVPFERRCDMLDQAMSERRGRQRQEHARSFADIVPAVRQKERERRDRGVESHRRVGIGDLDYLLGGDKSQEQMGGVGHGKLIYVGGPEKVGKTRFATAMISRLLFEHDAIVDWWSVEMGAEEMLHHFVANLSGISTYRLERDEEPMYVDAMSRKDFEYKRREVSEFLMTRAFTFLNPPGLSDQDILDRTRRMTRKHSEDIANGRPYIVVVDYIQDVQAASGARDERLQILKACKAVKTCAKTYGATVLAVFHSNRGPDTDEPESHNVYGSAQLGKDADHLLMLWRPEREHPRFKHFMRVFARRNRGGVQGHADFHAKMGCCQYRAWDDMKDCDGDMTLEGFLEDMRKKAKGKNAGGS